MPRLTMSSGRRTKGAASVGIKAIASHGDLAERLRAAATGRALERHGQPVRKRQA